MRRLSCMRPGLMWSTAMAVCLILAGLPRSAHAASPTITTFYTSTKAAFDGWAKTNYAPPPRAASFPSRTAVVAFYFAYKGASPNVTQFQIFIRDSSGATYSSDNSFTVAARNSTEMSTIVAPNKGVYRDGSYRADLLVDGAIAAHASFSVGGSAGSGVSSSGGSGESAATGLPSPMVPTFYTSTSGAQGAWASFKYLPPPPVATFFSGSTEIATYFEYLGATPGATTFRVVVANAGGSIVAEGKQFSASQYAGSNFISLAAPRTAPYPDGTYRAMVLVNGKTQATTQFSVGRRPGSAYLLFYPSTKAAAGAWAGNKYAPLPKTATFPAGTTSVVLFFVYTGVVANANYYQIIVRSSAGKAAYNGSASFFTMDASEQYETASPKGGFSPGSYKATLYVDALSAASATFTVGG